MSKVQPLEFLERSGNSVYYHSKSPALSTFGALPTQLPPNRRALWSDGAMTSLENSPSIVKLYALA